MPRHQKITPTVIDRLVGWVSPRAGFERIQYRQAMASAYAGASNSRRAMKSWTPSSSSPGDAILDDLPKLRERCNDLDRNNGLAHGAATKAAECVLGHGLALKARVDVESVGLSLKEGQALERQLERLWRIWATSTYADATERRSFHAIAPATPLMRYSLSTKTL